MVVRPGYKLTEVGVIPEDWVEKTFEGVFTGFTSGQTPSRSRPEYFKGNIPWITSGELNHGIIKDTLEKITEDAVKNTSLEIIPKGTFLFAITGLEAEGTRGNCAITGLDATTNQSCMALYSSGEVSTIYLFYYYEKYGNWLAFRYCQGTKQQSYSGVIARKLPIIYPQNPTEQRTIATTLSDADARITSLDQLIAKKRDIKQAAMQELLTGKRRLPGFDKEWSFLRMAENSHLKARIGWQGLTTAEYQQSGDFYLVTGTDFQNGRVNWSSCCFVDENRYSQDKYIQLKNGDILLTKDGTIGKVGYIEKLPGPATLNSGVFVIRPINGAYDSRFLYYILTSRIFEDFLTKLQAGSTIIHLYQKDFVIFGFLAPDIEEQHAIATVLSDMDAELETLEQQRDKAKAIKQGMMQELLTGRIRLI